MHGRLPEHHKSATCFSLEKTGDTKTRLTLDLYLTQNLAEAIMYRLFKKSRMTLTANKSLQRPIDVVDDIRFRADR